MGYMVRHQDGETYWHASESDELDSTCGGSGALRCRCGGDLCVCGNFGEAECFGCPDCEAEDDYLEEE